MVGQGNQGGRSGGGGQYRGDQLTAIYIVKDLNYILIIKKIVVTSLANQNITLPQVICCRILGEVIRLKHELTFFQSLGLGYN